MPNVDINDIAQQGFCAAAELIGAAGSNCDSDSVTRERMNAIRQLLQSGFAGSDPSDATLMKVGVDYTNAFATIVDFEDDLIPKGDNHYLARHNNGSGSYYTNELKTIIDGKNCTKRSPNAQAPAQWWLAAYYEDSTEATTMINNHKKMITGQLQDYQVLDTGSLITNSLVPFGVNQPTRGPARVDQSDQRKAQLNYCLRKKAFTDMLTDRGKYNYIRKAIYEFNFGKHNWEPDSSNPDEDGFAYTADVSCSGSIFNTTVGESGDWYRKKFQTKQSNRPQDAKTQEEIDEMVPKSKIEFYAQKLLECTLTNVRPLNGATGVAAVATGRTNLASMHNAINSADNGGSYDADNNNPTGVEVRGSDKFYRGRGKVYRHEGRPGAKSGYTEDSEWTYHRTDVDAYNSVARRGLVFTFTANSISVRDDGCDQLRNDIFKFKTDAELNAAANNAEANNADAKEFYHVRGMPDGVTSASSAIHSDNTKFADPRINSNGSSVGSVLIKGLVAQELSRTTTGMAGCLNNKIVKAVDVTAELTYPRQFWKHYEDNASADQDPLTHKCAKFPTTPNDNSRDALEAGELYAPRLAERFFFVPWSEVRRVVGVEEGAAADPHGIAASADNSGSVLNLEELKNKLIQMPAASANQNKNFPAVDCYLSYLGVNLGAGEGYLASPAAVTAQASDYGTVAVPNQFPNSSAYVPNATPAQGELPQYDATAISATVSLKFISKDDMEQRGGNYSQIIVDKLACPVPQPHENLAIALLGDYTAPAKNQNESDVEWKFMGMLEDQVGPSDDCWRAPHLRENIFKFFECPTDPNSDSGRHDEEKNLAILLGIFDNAEQSVPRQSHPLPFRKILTQYNEFAEQPSGQFDSAVATVPNNLHQSAGDYHVLTSAEISSGSYLLNQVGLNPLENKSAATYVNGALDTAIVADDSNSYWATGDAFNGLGLFPNVATANAVRNGLSVGDDSARDGAGAAQFTGWTGIVNPENRNNGDLLTEAFSHSTIDSSYVGLTSAEIAEQALEFIGGTGHFRIASRVPSYQEFADSRPGDLSDGIDSNFPEWYIMNETGNRNNKALISGGLSGVIQPAEAAGGGPQDALSAFTRPMTWTHEPGNGKMLSATWCSNVNYNPDPDESKYDSTLDEALITRADSAQFQAGGGMRIVVKIDGVWYGSEIDTAGGDRDGLGGIMANGGDSSGTVAYRPTGAMTDSADMPSGMDEYFSSGGDANTLVDEDDSNTITSLAMNWKTTSVRLGEGNWYKLAVQHHHNDSNIPDELSDILLVASNNDSNFDDHTGDANAASGDEVTGNSGAISDAFTAYPVKLPAGEVSSYGILFRHTHDADLGALKKFVVSSDGSANSLAFDHRWREMLFKSNLFIDSNDALELSLRSDVDASRTLATLYSRGGIAHVARSHMIKSAQDAVVQINRQDGEWASRFINLYTYLEHPASAAGNLFPWATLERRNRVKGMKALEDAVNSKRAAVNAREALGVSALCERSELQSAEKLLSQAQVDLQSDIDSVMIQIVSHLLVETASNPGKFDHSAQRAEAFAIRAKAQLARYVRDSGMASGDDVTFGGNGDVVVPGLDVALGPDLRTGNDRDMLVKWWASQGQDEGAYILSRLFHAVDHGKRHYAGERDWLKAIDPEGPSSLVPGGSALGALPWRTQPNSNYLTSLDSLYAYVERNDYYRTDTDHGNPGPTAADVNAFKQQVISDVYSGSSYDLHAKPAIAIAIAKEVQKANAVSEVERMIEDRATCSDTTGLASLQLTADSLPGISYNHVSGPSGTSLFDRIGTQRVDSTVDASGNKLDYLQILGNTDLGHGCGTLTETDIQEAVDYLNVLKKIADIIANKSSVPSPSGLTLSAYPGLKSILKYAGNDADSGTDLSFVNTLQERAYSSVKAGIDYAEYFCQAATGTGLPIPQVLTSILPASSNVAISGDCPTGISLAQVLIVANVNEQKKTMNRIKRVLKGEESITRKEWWKLLECSDLFTDQLASKDGTLVYDAQLGDASTATKVLNAGGAGAVDQDHVPMIALVNNGGNNGANRVAMGYYDRFIRGKNQFEMTVEYFKQNPIDKYFAKYDEDGNSMPDPSVFREKFEASVYDDDIGRVLAVFAGQKMRQGVTVPKNVMSLTITGTDNRFLNASDSNVDEIWCNPTVETEKLRRGIVDVILQLTEAEYRASKARMISSLPAVFEKLKADLLAEKRFLESSPLATGGTGLQAQRLTEIKVQGATGFYERIFNGGLINDLTNGATVSFNLFRTQRAGGLSAGIPLRVADDINGFPQMVTSSVANGGMTNVGILNTFDTENDGDGRIAAMNGEEPTSTGTMRAGNAQRSSSTGFAWWAPPGEVSFAIRASSSAAAVRTARPLARGNKATQSATAGLTLYIPRQSRSVASATVALPDDVDAATAPDESRYFPEFDKRFAQGANRAPTALEITAGYIHLLMDMNGPMISGQCNRDTPHEQIDCGGFVASGTASIDDSDVTKITEYNAGNRGATSQTFIGLGKGTAGNAEAFNFKDETVGASPGVGAVAGAALGDLGGSLYWVSRVEPTDEASWVNSGTTAALAVGVSGTRVGDVEGTASNGETGFFWYARDPTNKATVIARRIAMGDGVTSQLPTTWDRTLNPPAELDGHFTSAELTVNPPVTLSSSELADICPSEPTSIGFLDPCSSYFGITEINKADRLKAWQHWMEIAANDCKKYTKIENGTVVIHPHQSGDDVLTHSGSITSRHVLRNRQPVPGTNSAATTGAGNVSVVSNDRSSASGEIQAGTSLIPGSNDRDYERYKAAVNISVRDERPDHPQQYSCCVQEMARSYNSGRWTKEDKIRLEPDGTPHPNFTDPSDPTKSLIVEGQPRNLDHRRDASGALTQPDRVGGVFYRLAETGGITDDADRYPNRSTEGLELGGYAPGYQYQFDLIQRAIFLCDAKIALGAIISPLGWLELDTRDEIVVESDAKPFDATAENAPFIDENNDGSYDSNDRAVTRPATTGESAGRYEVSGVPRMMGTRPEDCPAQIAPTRYGVPNWRQGGVCHFEDFDRSAALSDQQHPMISDRDGTTGQVDFRSQSLDLRTPINMGNIKVAHKAEVIWFQELIKRANQEDGNGYYEIDWCKMPRLTESFQARGRPNSADFVSYDIKTTRFGVSEYGTQPSMKKPNRLIVREDGNPGRAGDSRNPITGKDGRAQDLTYTVSYVGTGGGYQYAGGWRGDKDLALLNVDCMVKSKGFEDFGGNMHNPFFGDSGVTDSGVIPSHDRKDDTRQFLSHPAGIYQYHDPVIGGWRAEDRFSKSIGPEKEWQRDLFLHMVSQDDFMRAFKVKNWKKQAQGGDYPNNFTEDQRKKAWLEVRRDLLCPRDVDENVGPTSEHYVRATFEEKFAEFYCTRKALNMIGLVMDPRRGARSRLNDMDPETGETEPGHLWDGWDELGFDPEVVRQAAIVSGHGTAHVQYDIEQQLKDAALLRVMRGMDNGPIGFNWPGDGKPTPKSLPDYGRQGRFLSQNFMHEDGVRAPDPDELKSLIHHLAAENALLTSHTHQGLAAKLDVHTASNGANSKIDQLVTEITSQAERLRAVENAALDSSASQIVVDLDNNAKLSKNEIDHLKDEIKFLKDQLETANTAIDSSDTNAATYYPNHPAVTQEEFSALENRLLGAIEQLNNAERVDRLEKGLLALLQTLGQVTGDDRAPLP